MVTLSARAVVPGEASGPLLSLAAPLSFWGGFEVATGRIVDRSHPDCGRLLTGTVLLMPAGRGSSSSSSILAEAIRVGTAPAAIVLAEPDPILVIGAMVARQLYGKACPIVMLSGGITAAEGVSVTVRASPDGTAAVTV